MHQHSMCYFSYSSSFENLSKPLLFQTPLEFIVSLDCLYKGQECLGCKKYILQNPTSLTNHCAFLIRRAWQRYSIYIPRSTCFQYCLLKVFYNTLPSFPFKTELNSLYSTHFCPSFLFWLGIYHDSITIMNQFSLNRWSSKSSSF